MAINTKRTAGVWQPRYIDRHVLVSSTKVDRGTCYVYFLADRNWPNLYSFDGTRVLEECSLKPNGRGYVYAFPLSWLEDEGPLPETLEQKRKEQYNKLKPRLGYQKKS